MDKKVMREDLIHPELSYKIIGCAYEVFNAIGNGHLEKVYQKAMAVALRKAGIRFTEQLEYNLYFSGVLIGTGRLDFLVDETIAVEIKRGDYFHPAAFEQLQEYLQSKKLKLGLLIRFSTNKVIYKRVLNSAA